MNREIILGIVGVLLIGLGLGIRYNRTMGILYLVTLHNNFISSTRFKVKGEKLHMKGYICSLTFKKLKSIIESNPQIKTIVFDKVMGSLDDASNFPMGIYLREKGLNTYMASNGKVASGGTDLFLSGVNRTIEKGASLGVHSWQGVNGVKMVEAKDLPRDHEKHRANAEYINSVLGSEDFYWYTIYAAPANGMHEMSLEEIEKYNIATKII